MMKFLAAAVLLIALTSHAAESDSTSPADGKSPAVAATTEAAAPVTPKESEIPLNLEAPKKSGDEGHPLFRILFAFSMMGVVGAGAVLFARKYSKSSFALSKHTQIKVLTQHYLGPKKSLAIIRVAGESILVGVTDHNISMIKSLALLDEDIPEETPANFSDVLVSDVSERVEFSSRPAASGSAGGEDEEFSIRGIKDVVSKKLKGMRTLQ